MYVIVADDTIVGYMEERESSSLYIPSDLVHADVLMETCCLWLTLAQHEDRQNCSCYYMCS